MATALERHAELVKAAQNLSIARQNYTLYGTDLELEEAGLWYDFAYYAYTNPFNVEKTVDARWPNVPK